MRTAALLLILAMMGPSVGALVCEWTCATKHERTSAGCHEHAGSGSPMAIASVDVCHERAAALESVLTSPQQTEHRAVVLSSAMPAHARPSSLPSVIRSGSSLAPPLLLIPLRI